MLSEPDIRRCVSDHLVVTAASLQSGIDFIEAKLKVRMSAGGSHVRMGTHNAILRLGDGLYLEVIAIQPDADPVSRARWFELDQLSASCEPRLATWVARTSDIEAAVAATGDWQGPVELMSRGELDWKITIPANGKMPFDGVAPALIQWNTSQHPTKRMPRADVSLLQLQMVHPEASEINRRLLQMGFEFSPLILPAVPGESPALVATFRTPTGEVQLGSD